MIYPFECHSCGLPKNLEARAFHPPEAPICPSCGECMNRVFGCQIDTSGCKDVDDIPLQDCVAYGGAADISRGQALAIEAAHGRHNEQTRRDLADGGNKGSFRKEMQIPAALYHSKIKQTKDRSYWEDPRNRNRHKSCKVN